MAAAAPAAAGAAGSGAPPSGPTGAAPGTAYVAKPPAPVQPPHTSATKSSPVAGHLPLAARSDGGTPAPIIALAIMLLVALVGALLAAAARYLGWGGGLLDPVRHAGGEAALRLGSATGWIGDLLDRAFPRRG